MFLGEQCQQPRADFYAHAFIEAPAMLKLPLNLLKVRGYGCR